MASGEYDSQAITRKIFFWTAVSAVAFAIAAYLLTY
jgi:hypothetical protein